MYLAGREDNWGKFPSNRIDSSAPEKQEERFPDKSTGVNDRDIYLKRG